MLQGHGALVVMAMVVNTPPPDGARLIAPALPKSAVAQYTFCVSTARHPTLLCCEASVTRQRPFTQVPLHAASHTLQLAGSDGVPVHVPAEPAEPALIPVLPASTEVKPSSELLAPHAHEAQ